MPKGYSHLTREERYHISALKKSGLSHRKIATQIGKHRSTIDREVKRLTTPKGGKYSPSKAHKKYLAGRQSKQEWNPIIKNYVLEKLGLFWSPEQISGRLKQDHPSLSISHEAIYRFIWKDKKNGGKLYENLLHSRKKYAKRGAKKKKRSLIPNRTDISQRPEIVEEKTRLGDFEGDLVIGASGSGALVTLVDRTSKLIKIGFISTKEAYPVRCKIQEMMHPLSDQIKTITFDNGREFSDHAAIASALDAEIYFATPYHSWERGLSEHTNGLIRKFFPKKMPFQDVSEENIQRVENLLNNRPRKVLNFKTPNEVFFSNSS